MILPFASSADERRRAASVAVLPVGSFEQHGAHLPLATDTLVACLIADEIAKVHDVLRLPPIGIACSHEHSTWPGTVSISPATLCLVVKDIAASLHRSGVSGLVLVNGHGGNYVLSNVVQESAAVAEGPRMALFPSWNDWNRARVAAGMSAKPYEDLHAGELETSLVMHGFPEAVGGFGVDDDWVNLEMPHVLTLGLGPYTETGVLGRPSLAGAEKGRLALGSLVQSFSGYFGVVGGEQ